MATDLRAALGQTVRRLRTAAGYSQEGFADAIGVHRTYMGTLERGGGNPTLETLELIGSGLGLPVSDLLLAAETGKLPAVSTSNPDRRSRQTRASRRGASSARPNR